jgi:uncharacterized membrane protein YagU involved in acid resistance
MTDLGLRVIMLFQDAESSFNWDDGMMALMITAMVMGGLAMMEWIRTAPKRQPRPAKARVVRAPAAPKAVSKVAAAEDTSEVIYVERTPFFSNIDWVRAIGAGLIGTALMTAVDMISNALGGPYLEVARNLAVFMGAPMEGYGWAAHVMIGIVLAIIYAGVFADTLLANLPGFVRGALYGLLPFFAAQLILVPVMGGGYFFAEMDDAAGGLVLLSLVGHLLYGAAIGFVYQPLEEVEESELTA